VIVWSSEVLQKVTSRNTFGAGTNESYPNHVVVMFVVVVVVVVHGDDGDDKVDNSLIPSSVLSFF
jgi:hypothetical protein